VCLAWCRLLPVCYARDEVLQNRLVVAEFDNPTAILRQVMIALEEIDSLSFRCKGLVQWLYEKAAFEWDDFTNALIDYQHSTSQRSIEQGPVYVPWIHSAAPPSVVAPPVAAQPLQTGMTIAFMTYELAPNTAGGAGVVISALIMELLARGHRVLLIGYMGKDTLDGWCAKALGDADASHSADHHNLVCFDVPSLLAERNVHVNSHPNIFVSRARQFAHAAREVYSMEPFNLLEIFDYAGIGFELLHRRYANALNEDSTRAMPYLPVDVPVIVRLHGSLELISVAESIPPTTEQRTMFLMEQFCLETADLIFAQSAAMRNFYAQVYGLNPSRITVAALQ
jgi:hypothetical protein